MNQVVIQILGVTARGQLVRSPIPCEFALECESFVIGSNPGSTPHVRIDNPTVSRRHVLAESLGDDRWRVCDAGSDNGTILINTADDSAESAFSDRNWRAACQRITEVEIGGPATLLIGEVVVRIVPVASRSSESLSDVSAEISESAQRRGLTPEILHSILNEA